MGGRQSGAPSASSQSKARSFPSPASEAPRSDGRHRTKYNSLAVALFHHITHPIRMNRSIPSPQPRWELAAEAIAVKIRWFGLLLGYLYVNLGADPAELPTLNAILAVGLGYTLLDTYYFRRGRVFLGNRPLFVSCMEALFIGLLCYFEGSLESPFRFYYLLSLICCALRHPNRITYITCALDCLSYTVLYLALPSAARSPLALFLLLVILVWVTWAASALSRLLKQIGEHLARLNGALREHQAQLENRIVERTRELQETQAQLMHQEKMAGFGLLAAGIAHEVGNPLTSISTLVQMLQRRDCDSYTHDKLGLVNGQLARIQTILRELMNFSRPASQEKTRFHVREIVDEALGIAKYYKGTKNRIITTDIPPEVPVLHGVRDQLVQVVFNLILNAMDATGKGGSIEVSAYPYAGCVAIEVRDNGAGIPVEQQPRIFQAYFTTKKRGTGLGLFVTRKLVQEHGGQVQFESRVGAGTSFRIELPSADGVIPLPLLEEEVLSGA
jgi:two-component system, NtrC family, sensor kinase